MASLPTEENNMFANQKEVDRRYGNVKSDDVEPDVTETPETAEGTQDSVARGGGFTVDQETELRSMKQLTLDQNPFFTFYWNNAKLPIAVDDFLVLPCGFTPNADLFGEIPLRNGFITGFTVVTDTTIAGATGLQFRLYRNGVASDVVFQITDHDNVINPNGNAGGAVRARGFSSSAGDMVYVNDEYIKKYHFKSSEKLALMIEPIQLPGYSTADNIVALAVKLYYNFASWTAEEMASQKYGGGVLDGVPGGGDGAGQGGIGTGGSGGGGGIVCGGDINMGLEIVFIKALAQAAGELHLSDAVNWDTSKALIETIVIKTTSTDWDAFILQNDKGHVTDDANIPMMQIMANGSGDANINLDNIYEDEDDSKKVHLFFRDNSGAATADIYIIGLKAE